MTPEKLWLGKKERERGLLATTTTTKEEMGAKHRLSTNSI
jgi:hypothetical protein